METLATVWILVLVLLLYGIIALVPLYALTRQDNAGSVFSRFTPMQSRRPRDDRDDYSSPASA